MKVLKSRGTIRLIDLPNGELFMFGETIALKSEYKTDKGACECHIVGSGEMFWGGAKTASELNNLSVTPLRIDRTKKQGILGIGNMF